MNGARENADAAHHRPPAERPWWVRSPRISQRDDVTDFLSMLAANLDRAEWMTDAVCVSSAFPDLWFPEVGSGDAMDAKKLCGTCPVRRECLTYALAYVGTSPLKGIWGGTTESERRTLRTHYRKATA